jgi:hypothetical protein
MPQCMCLFLTPLGADATTYGLSFLWVMRIRELPTLSLKPRSRSSDFANENDGTHRAGFQVFARPLGAPDPTDARFSERQQLPQFAQGSAQRSFSPSGGAATLAAQRLKDAVVTSVTGRGAGIWPEVKHKVLD